jgi:hypothetical protein
MSDWLLARQAIEVLGKTIGYEAAAEQIIKRAADGILDARADTYVWFDINSNQEEDVKAERTISKVFMASEAAADQSCTSHVGYK